MQVTPFRGDGPGVDGDVAWIVGEADTVLRTVDGGRTWDERPTVTRAGASKPNWKAVAAFSRDIAWVGGDEGTIMRTADGSLTWKQTDTGVSVNLLRIAGAGGSVWTIGPAGTILHARGRPLP